MMRRSNRVLKIALMGAVGLLAGLASGYVGGRATLRHSARMSMTSFADELVGHANDYEVELQSLYTATRNPPGGNCSKADVQNMRALSFLSRHVRGLARVEHGLLMCSGVLGVLNPPMPMGGDPMVLPGGTIVYSDVPLFSAGGAKGLIIQYGDMSMLLSPTAYSAWQRADARFMVAVIDPRDNRMVFIGGERIAVDPAWIRAEGSSDENGVLRRAQCSHVNLVCAVTEETQASILYEGGPLLQGYSNLGGVTGLLLGLIMGMLLYGHMGLGLQLRRAIRTRSSSLRLVYQPVLSVPSRECVGAEALLRWNDQEGAAVAPDLFVRVAEDRGFIRELTALVVNRAIHEMADVLRANERFTLSINVSAEDVRSSELLELLRRTTSRAGVRPQQIALELTERSTAEFPVLREALSRLRAEGYKVHIDDFGTGYSSLAYLAELEIDAIKVDRGFTRTIGTEAVTATIVPQVMAMAEGLGLDVIVEGVETEDQYEYLANTGYPVQAQGWYFSHPVAAADLPVYFEWTAAATR